MPILFEDLDGRPQERVAASPEFARARIVDKDRIPELRYGVFSRILVKL